MPRGAAITSALVGQFAAIAMWLGHTKYAYGELTVDTAQNLPPTMVRTLCKLTPLPLCHQACLLQEAFT